ncbi:unnamed protein product [Toxocara canis]|uniref:Secreted protein n=1 Tax=Toxocara canis TaxID=6265 RepID=A0A183VE36_TOXCA|nr:unnamed protein product [Toxocara canis]
MRRRRRLLVPVVVLVAFTLLFNEYLIYYTTVLFGCSWPTPYNTATSVSRIAIIADTHLLGRIRGHWFDKLRRFASFILAKRMIRNPEKSALRTQPLVLLLKRLLSGVTFQ